MRVAGGLGTGPKTQFLDSFLMFPDSLSPYFSIIRPHEGAGVTPRTYHIF